MPDAPLAYFLTWHTYGTWLHGDARGSVDPAHNRIGADFIPPTPNRKLLMRQMLVQPSFKLNEPQRRAVLDAE